MSWIRENQDHCEIQSCMVQALAKAGVCATLQDLDRNYLRITNLFEPWSVGDQQDPTESSIFGPELGEKLEKLKDRVVASGESESFEYEPDAGNAFEFDIHMIESPKGDPYLITVVRDASGRKAAERVTLSLLREVSHRSKNLLAIVQSIANQTARFSDNIDSYLRQFRGRLHSLANAQDLVTDSDWKGARLKDLITKQARKYFPRETVFSLQGDDIVLSPNASLHLGLALHELIVLASSGEPLPTPANPIRVTSTLTGNGSGYTAVLVWSEKFPNSKNPNWKPPEVGELEVNRVLGFERTLLERIVPTALNGTAELVLADEELRYEIAFPINTAE